ncbi:MAG TPA: hypothetical protein VFW55_03920, partial [Propionicimonas sp.]|nr:hypothetical protein [Propionicimonas sp.]
PGDHTIGFDQTHGESRLSGVLQRHVAPGLDFVVVKQPVMHGNPTVSMPIDVTIDAWTPAVERFEYQWYRGAVPITGATAATYIPTDVDAPYRLRVSVTGVKHRYATVTTWAQASRLTGGGVFAVRTPQIVGTTKTGATLSIAMESWWPTPQRITYRWYRDHKAIRNATKATYTLGAADLGKRITVSVKGSSECCGTRSAKSSSTKRVTQGPVHSSLPVVIGQPLVGSRLTLNRGAWGPGKLSYRYQWTRDGKAIPKARASSYRLTTADAGHRIAVAVRGDRRSYTAVTRLSTPVAIAVP